MSYIVAGSASLSQPLLCYIFWFLLVAMIFSVFLFDVQCVVTDSVPGQDLSLTVERDSADSPSLLGPENLLVYFGFQLLLSMVQVSLHCVIVWFPMIGVAVRRVGVRLRGQLSPLFTRWYQLNSQFTHFLVFHLANLIFFWYHLMSWFQVS